jgi:hypothetical protein
MVLTLIERANILALRYAPSGKRSAGVLVLAPLATATASAQTAKFGPATFSSHSNGGEDQTQVLTSNTTQAQLLENDTHLKIFGGLNLDTGAGGGSGSSFHYEFDWTGNWNAAPSAGDPFTIDLTGTLSFRTGGGSGNASYFLGVDLNNDGTFEYQSFGSMSGTDPVFHLNLSGTMLAPVSGAVSYHIELDVNCGHPFTEYPGAGVTVDLPQNSIDLIAVPEPRVELLFMMAVALLALCRIRWRKRKRA